MSKRRFEKPPTTFLEQADQLRTRGMVFEDAQKVAGWLERLNYYRLGAYWLPYESDHFTHRFCEGTRFDDVLRAYFFDRELRLLLLDAQERIEVAVRTRWAYELAHRHGTHAHLNHQLFEENHWVENLAALNREVSRSGETFIKHLRTTYIEPVPCVWAVCEVMSFGQLSRWYDSLKPRATRNAIASPFGLDDDLLASWLQHLSHVRNFCAHHARVWNREFTMVPKLARTKPARLAGSFVSGSRDLYNTLVIILYLMDVIAPDHTVRDRLRALMHEYQPTLSVMGFPAGWETLDIWQATSC